MTCSLSTRCEMFQVTHYVFCGLLSEYSLHFSVARVSASHMSLRSLARKCVHFMRPAYKAAFGEANNKITPHNVSQCVECPDLVRIRHSTSFYHYGLRPILFASDDA